MISKSLELDELFFHQSHSKYDSTLEIKHYHPVQFSSSEEIILKGNLIDYYKLKLNKTDGRKIKLPNNREVNIKDDIIRLESHSDLSSITILLQNEIGGLQVKTLDGNWIDAPSLPNHLLVNTGL